MRKHILFFMLCASSTFSVLAQWTNNGDNSSTGNLTIGTNDRKDTYHTIKGGGFDGGGTGVIFDYGDKNVVLRSRREINSTIFGIWTWNNLKQQSRLYINNQGNVAIGADFLNPETELHVKGTVTADKLSTTSLDVNDDINLQKNLIIPGSGQITRSASNQFSYDGRSMGHYAIGWGMDSWYSGGPTLWQSAYGGIKFFTFREPRMSINRLGNVGIGTINPQAKLDVRGTISAEEVKVQVLTGADHVFNTNYDLKPLSEVKAFVEENKHLPEIPSEKHMQENGLNINEFQIKLLQKIEELTLYVIKQDEEIQKLKEALSEK